MKRLFAASGIIVLLLVLSSWHVIHLDHYTGELIEQLEQTQRCLAREDWAAAESLVRGAYDSWGEHAFYLHTTLRHEDIDAIRACFREALAYLSLRQDAGECAAVNARLINQLELLLEAELPSIKNLL